MNTPKWIRDANIIKSNFKKLGSSWVAINDCDIYFPVGYAEKRLAFIGDTIKTLGIVMIAINNTYAVLSVNSMIEFSPSEVTTVDMSDGKYYKMSFDKGTMVIENIHVVKQDTLPYFIYDYFISKGRVPWYMNYIDMCRLFDTAKEYADANVGTNPEVIQAMISVIARDKDNRNTYYRQIASIDPVNDRLVFIPIRSVEYGATNTVNKLGGNYMSTGIISALNNPSDKVENIESILRK